MRRYACVEKHNGISGGFCEECFQKQLIIDRQKEEIEQLRAQLRYRKKKDNEPFGISTPSSKIHIKKSSLEEEQAKKGGGKPGHKGKGRQNYTEEEVDEKIELTVNLETCPHCHTKGSLEFLRMEIRSICDSLILEALKILYYCEVKKCKNCKREITKKPNTFPKFKYGNNLIAETVIQHYGHGTPLKTISRMWGKEVSTSSLQNILHYLADRVRPAIGKLEGDLQRSHVKHADETGWRTDGKNGYTWLFATPDISLFYFNKNRSAEIPAKVLGKEKLPGILIVDRYNAYNKVPCKIQYCYEHLKRDLIDVKEKNPKNEEIDRFVKALLPRIRRAIMLPHKTIPDKTYYTRSKVLEIRIKQCINSSASHPAIQKYQDIFRDKEARLFHWVSDRSIPCHNNRAERELRPLVVARKTSFGSQSDRGADTRSVLTSYIQTAAKRLKDCSLKIWFRNTLDQLASDPITDPYFLLP